MRSTPYDHAAYVESLEERHRFDDNVTIIDLHNDAVAIVTIRDDEETESDLSYLGSFSRNSPARGYCVDRKRGCLLLDLRLVRGNLGVTFDPLRDGEGRSFYLSAYPPQSGESVRAARRRILADWQRYESYLNGHWHMLILEIDLRVGAHTVARQSLGQIESDDKAYIARTVQELLAHTISSARADISREIKRLEDALGERRAQRAALTKIKAISISRAVPIGTNTGHESEEG